MYKVCKNIETETREMREVFADTMMELAENDKKVIYLDGDIMNSIKMVPFSKKFPKQTIDCGIQEANMVGVAAGMSSVIYYIPFTSILVVPGKLLVGDMPLAGAIVSLLITLLCTLIIIVFSGKLYSMTALYSGAPLTPKKAFMMLKSKKGKQ